MNNKITYLTGRHGIPAPDLLAELMNDASYFKLLRFDPENSDTEFAREIAMAMHAAPDVLVLDRSPGPAAMEVITRAREAGTQVRIEA